MLKGLPLVSIEWPHSCLMCMSYTRLSKWLMLECYIFYFWYH